MPPQIAQQRGCKPGKGSFLRNTLYLVFITNFLFRLGKLALLSPFFSYQSRALMVLLPAIGTQIPCFRDSKNLFFSAYFFFLLRDSKLYFETYKVNIDSFFSFHFCSNSPPLGAVNTERTAHCCLGWGREGEAGYSRNNK